MKSTGRLGIEQVVVTLQGGVLIGSICPWGGPTGARENRHFRKIGLVRQQVN